MPRRVRPWDAFFKRNHTNEEEQKRRFEICRTCPEFIRATNQCSVCGCLMHIKTKLRDAVCPIGKW